MTTETPAEQSLLDVLELEVARADRVVQQAASDQQKAKCKIVELRGALRALAAERKADVTIERLREHDERLGDAKREFELVQAEADRLADVGARSHRTREEAKAKLRRAQERAGGLPARIEERRSFARGQLLEAEAAERRAADFRSAMRQTEADIKRLTEEIEQLVGEERAHRLLAMQRRAR